MAGLNRPALSASQTAQQTDKVEIRYVASPTLRQFHSDDDSFVKGIRGPIGCVPPDTEYLTVEGWRPVADYLNTATRQPVATVDPNQYPPRLSFERPTDFIRHNSPPAPLYRFITRSEDDPRLPVLDMHLTEDHRVYYYPTTPASASASASTPTTTPTTTPTPARPVVEPAQYYAEKLRHRSRRFSPTVPVTFTPLDPDAANDLPMTPAEIALVGLTAFFGQSARLPPSSRLKHLNTHENAVYRLVAPNTTTALIVRVAASLAEVPIEQTDSFNASANRTITTFRYLLPREATNDLIRYWYRLPADALQAVFTLFLNYIKAAPVDAHADLIQRLQATTTTTPTPAASTAHTHTHAPNPSSAATTTPTADQAETLTDHQQAIASLLSTHSNTLYVTDDPRMADRAQFMCHALGYRAALYPVAARTRQRGLGSPSVHYAVRLYADRHTRQHPPPSPVSRTSVEPVPPPPAVYCFTTRTGAWLARHNGQIFVTGNSGKSVGAVNELLKRALSQQPNAQNIRKSRWALVRQTYPELRSTTIKTFQDWIPDSICPIKLTDSPINGRLVLPLPDKTVVMAEFLFIALDKPRDLGKLLSLELTGAFLNEAKECEKAVIDGLTSRVGRYPSRRDGGPTWSGVIMDTNAPDSSHWYAQLEREPPDKWKFYVQPPALLQQRDNTYAPNPKAENVEHQPKGYDYWLDSVAGKDTSWIRAYVLNQFAIVSAGRPVYGEYFSEAYHVSKNKLWPVKNAPVYVGFDFGLTPAAVFIQLIPDTGQLRILDAISAVRMGFKNFLVEAVLPLVAEKYHRNERYYVGDPSGVRSADTDERSCFDIGRQLGVNILPASTNTIEPRLEGVRQWLTRNVAKGQPALLVSPHCTELIEGFASGYQYARIQISGEARYRDKPDKNRFSHAHDALQYAVDRVNINQRRSTDSRRLPSTSRDAGRFVAVDSITGY